MFDGLFKTVVDMVKQFAGKAAAAGPPPVPTAPAISVEPRIEAMYQAGIRDKVRPCAIREIVVHGTAGGTTMDSLVNWMLSGEQDLNYKKGIGLFHFAIDRGGLITQVINPRYWVYHSLSGLHDQETIGIELINPTRDNGGPYTDEQYSALADLIDYMMRINPNCRQIVSHNYNGLTYSRIGKNCPGNFSWSRLGQSLSEKKWNVRSINQEVLYVA